MSYVEKLRLPTFEPRCNYDADGTELWTRQFSSSDDDPATGDNDGVVSVAVDDLGVYLAGIQAVGSQKLLSCPQGFDEHSFGLRTARKLSSFCG